MIQNPGIDILNVGDGHTEVNFDPSNYEDVQRAAKLITDMLRRGFVLFIPAKDGVLCRVDAFDPKQNTYIIGDMPEEEAPPESKPIKRGKYKSRAIPIQSTRPTAIARSAGG